MKILSFLKIIFKELTLLIIPISLSCILTPILFCTFSLKYYDIVYSKFQNIAILIAENNSETFIDFLFNNELFQNVVFLFLSFVTLQFFHLIAGMILSYLLPKINKKLKETSFRYALGLNLDFFNTKNSGDIEKNIFNLADSFCSMVEFSFLFINKIVQLIMCLIFCLKFKTMFLIVLMWVLIMSICGFICFKVIIRESSKRNEYQNIQTGFICESLDNVIILKLNKCYDFIFNKFNKNQSDEDKAYSTVNKLFGITRFVFGTINVFCFSVAILSIIKMKLVYHGLNSTFYFLQFWNTLIAIWEIMWAILPTFYAFGRLDRSLLFLDLKKDDKEYNYTHDIDKFEILEIHNLNFKYKEVEIFKNFSLILKNEFLLIDGSSGIGKSTLFNLIINLKDCGKNTIFFNGYDLKSITDIYKIISYVPQKDYIFNDTIKNNITLGLNYNQSKFNELINILQIDKFISMEDIDKKLCGPFGSQISGGQARRISLARTLLFDNPNKLLLLDEPFNNLSKDIISNLMLYIKENHKNRPVICIDHTQNFRSICDTIININDI